MTDEEPKFLRKVDGRTVDKKGNFTVLDPAKVTGKDIVALWRAELERLADMEKAAEADKKKEP
jgi:hypothetical protein